MHFCQDEAAALLATIPFIGIYLVRIKAWLHRLFHRCPKRLDTDL